MAQIVVEYMKLQGFKVFEDPGRVNIVYFEGLNPEFKPETSLWCDIRTVIKHAQRGGEPYFSLITPATVEPGKVGVMSETARKVGGIDSIALGQHTAWRLWFHRFARFGRLHPALTQAKPLQVYTDHATGSPRTGATKWIQRGLDQHGTFPGYSGGNYGNGTGLTGQWWKSHLDFMFLCENDAAYKAAKAKSGFFFTTTIIRGSDFLQWFSAENKFCQQPVAIWPTANP